MGRGVQQGDPLSPYLFLLCVELLADGIKSDSNVKGVKIQDKEFIHGQYADGTFFLDGTESSQYHCLNTLGLFAECSGLRVHINKAKATWSRCKRHSDTILLPFRNLTWLFGKTFEVLGLMFSTELNRIPVLNYSKNIDKIKKTPKMLVIVLSKCHWKNTGYKSISYS